MATVAGNVVFIRNALTGEIVSTLVSPGPIADSFHSAAWSIDGTKLFTAGLDDVVRVWDITTASVITEFPQSADVRSMAMSTDGSRLAVGYADGMVQVLNATTGATLDSFQGSYPPDPRVMFLKWHPNGNQIASASFDEITVWDFTTNQIVNTFPQIEISVPEAMDYSPDGVFAYAGEAGSIRMVPIANPGPNQTLTDADNDGSELVTLNGTASTDPDGTIDTYEWLENGVVIAEGDNPQVKLDVGEHTITLKVTDNDGLVDIAEVVIEVVY